jgi:hypothetical protein
MTLTALLFRKDRVVEPIERVCHAVEAGNHELLSYPSIERMVY